MRRHLFDRQSLAPDDRLVRPCAPSAAPVTSTAIMSIDTRPTSRSARAADRAPACHWRDGAASHRRSPRRESRWCCRARRARRRRSPRVSPRFTSRTVSTVVSSVIAGLESELGRGLVPRTARRRTAPGPGRTQSPCASRPAEDAGRIGDAALERAAGARHGASRRRAICSRGHRLVEFIGTRQVRHHAQLRRRTVSARSVAQRGGKFLGPKPEAVHAGVDLDPDD